MFCSFSIHVPCTEFKQYHCYVNGNEWMDAHAHSWNDDDDNDNNDDNDDEDDAGVCVAYMYG